MIQNYITPPNKEVWANWILENKVDKNGVSGKTKIPVQGWVKGAPRASSTDTKTWTTFNQAREHGNCAIMLNSEVLAIDFDKVLDPTTQKIVDKRTEEFFKLMPPTFIEVSQSGTGLHVYYKLSEGEPAMAGRKIHGGDTLESSTIGYEYYTQGRFFAYTGVCFNTHASFAPIHTLERGMGSIMQLLGRVLGFSEKKKTSNNVDALKNAKGNNIDNQVQYTDDFIVKNLFNQRGGEKWRSIYNGDTSAYNNDTSSADLALVQKFCFYTRDSVQLERLWAQSPLGDRKKTQTVSGYRTRTIQKALENTEGQTMYDMPETRDHATKSTSSTSVPPMTNARITKKSEDIPYIWRTTLVKGEGGETIEVKKRENCRENIYLALMREPAFCGRIRYDEFHRKIFIDKEPLDDRHITLIAMQLGRFDTVFLKCTSQQIQEMMHRVGYDNTFDSAVEELKKLPAWDKVPRINTFVQRTFGMVHSSNIGEIGANFIKSMVARLSIPYSKVDTVFVFEGKQGYMKTTFLQKLSLVPEWHAETTLTLDSKDFFQNMGGKAIYELSEGTSARRSDMSKLKAMVTTIVDTYRPVYARYTQDFPRRCVITMTVNSFEINDITGGRRWACITVPNVADFSFLNEYKLQLWAEAYEKVHGLNGTPQENWWSLSEQMQKELEEDQSDRKVQSYRSTEVEQWYGGLSAFERNEGITIYDAFKQTRDGQGDFAVMTHMVERDISETLRLGMFLVRKPKMKNRVRGYSYFPTDQTTKKYPVIERDNIVSPIQQGSVRDEF